MPQPMGTKLIGAGRYERVLIGRLGRYPIGGMMRVEIITQERALEMANVVAAPVSV